MAKEPQLDLHPLPQYRTWSEAVRRQRDVVDRTITSVNERMGRLMSQNPISTPDLVVLTGLQQVLAEDYFFKYIEASLTPTHEETTSAPEALQMLFRDLNVQHDTPLWVRAWYRATPGKNLRDRGYVNPASTFRFVPKEYDPQRLGIEVETFMNSDWPIIESGMRIDWSQAPRTHTERNEQLWQTLQLIQEGQVRRMYDIGTHAATTGYEHMPSEYWAHILQASADWSLSLINVRLKASGQPEVE